MNSSPLGRPGSRLHERRLRCLCVLVEAADEPEALSVRDIVERGYKRTEAALPYWDYFKHGSAVDCDNGRERLAFMDLMLDVQTALRTLRTRGFAQSRRAHEPGEPTRGSGSSQRLLWRVTTHGRNWLLDDLRAFRREAIAGLKDLFVTSDGYDYLGPVT